ncbi:MAG: hypothetical protein ACXW00_03085, partial [Methylobacter sp.]
DRIADNHQSDRRKVRKQFLPFFCLRWFYPSQQLAWKCRYRLEKTRHSHNMQEYLQVFGRAAESVSKSGEIMSAESQQLSAPMASSS